MTDSGRVLSSGKELAEVEVECFEACHDCSARSLCIGNKQNKGRISVKNPLHAEPGDEVRIRIPEEHYSRALILIFGGLLCALILGLGGGYLLGRLFSVPASTASIIGLVVGLMMGGFVLFRTFRRKNEEYLYPEIIAIIKKGDCYGSA